MGDIGRTGLIRSVVRASVALAFALPSVAVAQWQLTTVTDSMTDRRTLIARPVDTQRVSVSFLSNPDGSRWVWIALLDGQHISSTRRPTVRVDTLPAIDLNVRGVASEPLGAFPTAERHINGKLWAWQLQPGPASAARSGFHRQVASGSRLRVRVWTLSGTAVEAEYSLHGAAPVIEQAFGLDGVDRDAQALLEVVGDLRFDAKRTCSERAIREDWTSCMNRFEGCVVSARSAAAALGCAP